MGKDFMNMIKRFWWTIFLLGCEPDLPPYEVPYIPFDDIYINLSLPEYQALQFDGGHYVIPDSGVKGLILYRESSEKFICYDRQCTWEPFSACSEVDVDASNLFMIDHCCGSTFEFSQGYPIGGIAIYPLQQYRVYNDGLGGITITDELVNL